MDDLYPRLIGLGFVDADFLIQDDSDGRGPYIREWYSERAQPSEAQLAAALLRGPVPASLTPLQARKALRMAGLKAAVDAYVADLPEEDREDWEYATAIERDHKVIADAIAFGLVTEAQVDQLFAIGATL